MKAVVYEKFGPPEVLQLKEVATPRPGDNEVFIKIFATTVSSGDARIRGFDVNPLMWLPMRAFLGFGKPRKPILGYTLSGEIVSVGKDVKRFKERDPVFGSTGMDGGAYAEYICLPEDGNILIKPEGMSHEEAASIPFGGPTALHFFRRAGLESGQSVLIYGASGSVGTAAVQLAKHFGADVTGVCGTANLEMVKSLGAGRVIDYTVEDFSAGGESYDIVFDTVGKSPFSACMRSLKKRGRYLRAVHMELLPLVRGLWVNMTSGKKVIGGIASDDISDLEHLKDLFPGGSYKPVIDRQYSLEEIIEAHRYVETGHKKGNVVITMEHKNEP